MHRPATAATTAAPRTFEAIALKQISNYVNTAVMSPHSWKGGIDAFNAAELRIALGKKNSSAEEGCRIKDEEMRNSFTTSTSSSETCSTGYAPRTKQSERRWHRTDSCGAVDQGERNRERYMTLRR